MNLTKVRDTFNMFNDTFHHINYKPKVILTIDRFTYEIYTWIVFSLVILVLGYIFSQTYFNKSNNKINVIIEEPTYKIVNEAIVSNQESKL